jgi:hypothetical protein
MTAGDDNAFDRGVSAGKIEQRLKDHDKHLSAINGSVAHVADRLDGIDEKIGSIFLTLQRIADGTTADKRTVITTAEAVEKERISKAEAVEETRRTRDQRWSPLTRWAAAVAILGSIAGIVALVISNR